MSIRAEFRAHVRNGWKFSRKFFQLTPPWGTDFTDDQVLAHAQLGRSPYYPVNGVVNAWTPVKEYADTALNHYTYADTQDGRYAHLIETRGPRLHGAGARRNRISGRNKPRLAIQQDRGQVLGIRLRHHAPHDGSLAG